jgi:hypothetical protein
MARNRYDVVPTANGWAVKHLGSVLSNHGLKAPAVDAGVRAARANEPSSLYIHLQNGQFEEERTYGDDPFPPRG